MDGDRQRGTDRVAAKNEIGSCALGVGCVGCRVPTAMHVAMGAARARKHGLSFGQNVYAYTEKSERNLAT